LDRRWPAESSKTPGRAREAGREARYSRITRPPALTQSMHGWDTMELQSKS
jgi:hypothetical protein